MQRQRSCELRKIENGRHWREWRPLGLAGVRRLDLEGRMGCVVKQDGNGATGEAGFG